MRRKGVDFGCALAKARKTKLIKMGNSKPLDGGGGVGGKRPGNRNTVLSYSL